MLSLPDERRGRLLAPALPEVEDEELDPGMGTPALGDKYI
jgi:hypothetical protein